MGRTHGESSMSKLDNDAKRVAIIIGHLMCYVIYILNNIGLVGLKYCEYDEQNTQSHFSQCTVEHFGYCRQIPTI